MAILLLVRGSQEGLGLHPD